MTILSAALTITYMTDMTENRAKIKEIASHFGGVPKLAKLMGITRCSLYMWQQIPLGRAYQIEVLSKGRFKAKDLIAQKIARDS